MGNLGADPDPNNKPKEVVQKSLPVPLGDALAGADALLDNDAHFGVTLRLRSSGPPSALVIPDVLGVPKGKPVYLTRPVVLEGAKLKNYLVRKEVTIPPAIGNLLETTTASCNAFYVQKNGPILMSFSLNFTKGLIGALTDDQELGELFDVTGVAVRVLRSDKESLAILEKYVAELTEPDEAQPVKAIRPSTPQLPAETVAPEATS